MNLDTLLRGHSANKRPKQAVMRLVLEKEGRVDHSATEVTASDPLAKGRCTIQKLLRLL